MTSQAWSRSGRESQVLEQPFRFVPGLLPAIVRIGEHPSEAIATGVSLRSFVTSAADPGTRCTSSFSHVLFINFTGGP